MADSFTPNIAPQTDGSGNAPEQAQPQPEATEPVPITEQEVGEYREQDRYLPVSPRSPARSLFPPRHFHIVRFVAVSPPPPPPLLLLTPPHFIFFFHRRLATQKKQKTKKKIANVSRIMKNAVPPTAKIAKDAKECVQECVSEFISFITSEAAEKCQLEKRKTIGGEDILYAMVSLGFENYAETLKIHLAKLRQVRCGVVPATFLPTLTDRGCLCLFFLCFSSISRRLRLVEKLGRIRKRTQRTECNLHRRRTLNLKNYTLLARSPHLLQLSTRSSDSNDAQASDATCTSQISYPNASFTVLYMSFMCVTVYYVRFTRKFQTCLISFRV